MNYLNINHVAKKSIRTNNFCHFFHHFFLNFLLFTGRKKYQYVKIQHVTKNAVSCYLPVKPPDNALLGLLIIPDIFMCFSKKILLPYIRSAALKK